MEIELEDTSQKLEILARNYSGKLTESDNLPKIGTVLGPNFLTLTVRDTNKLGHVARTFAAETEITRV